MSLSFVGNPRNRQFLDLMDFLDENGRFGWELLQFENMNWFESKLDLKLNYSDTPFRPYSFAICPIIWTFKWILSIENTLCSEWHWIMKLGCDVDWPHLNAISIPHRQVDCAELRWRGGGVAVERTNNGMSITDVCLCVLRDRFVELKMIFSPEFLSVLCRSRHYIKYSMGEGDKTATT